VPGALPPPAAVASDSRGETLQLGGSRALLGTLPPPAAAAGDGETLLLCGSCSLPCALPPLPPSTVACDCEALQLGGPGSLPGALVAAAHVDINTLYQTADGWIHPLPPGCGPLVPLRGRQRRRPRATDDAIRRQLRCRPKKGVAGAGARLVSAVACAVAVVTVARVASSLARTAAVAGPTQGL
jgi:hypothetical protein